MNVLEVKQLQIMRDQRVIIDNLSFELPEGHRLFLQGDIGCGKSTLLHCLLGFIPYQQGEIRWFGNTCRQEKDFVPQPFAGSTMVKVPALVLYPDTTTA